MTEEVKDILDDMADNAFGRSQCVMDYHLQGYHDKRVVPIGAKADENAKELVDIEGRVEALEKAKLLGQHIVTKVGEWPVPPPPPTTIDDMGTPDPNPDPPEPQRAILWGVVTDPELDANGLPNADPEPLEWHLLVFLYEITGPKGDNGLDGQAGLNGIDGKDGKDGAVGPQGPQGPKGDPGQGIKVRDVVNQFDNLTGLEESPEVGDIYIVLQPHSEFYVYVGPNWLDKDSWRDLGPASAIKGDKGDMGPQGPAGANGRDGADGKNGANGKDGKQGPRGPKGEQGGVSSFILSWIVSTATNQALTQVQIQINNQIEELKQAVLNELEASLTTLVESTVEEAVTEGLRDKKGDKGDDGKDGKDGKDGRACTIRGTIKNTGQLPTADESHEGDAYIMEGTKDLYVCYKDGIGPVQAYDWHNVGNIKGPQGDKGEVGDWTIQLLGDRSQPVGSPLKIEETAEGVPNLYIQGRGGVTISPFQDSQVGFVIELEEKPPEEPPEKLLIKGANGMIYALTVDVKGRLTIDLDSAL